MSESKSPAAAAPADARPVSALLYPTNGLREHAKAAGELGRLLGPGELGASMSGDGQFVRVMHPGAVSLGVRFFDWGPPLESSPFCVRLGRLKPAAEIREIVGQFGPRTSAAERAAAFEGMRAELVFDVERFRTAVGS